MEPDRMNNLTKIRLGWKYRRQLWKYRGLIRRRKQIMGIAAAVAAIATVAFLEAPCARSSRDNG
jgi:hypothetical protein